MVVGDRAGVGEGGGVGGFGNDGSANEKKSK